MPNSVILIKPSRGWVPVDLKSLWEYRDLLYFLTWRDIKVRYKQTLIGAGWAILQPFFTMIVFTIFFGKMAKVPSEGVPYPIFSYAGLLLWTYFSGAVTNSGNSLVGSANLVTKIYFPRLILPLSSSLAGILDYFIALSILIVMMFIYKVTPSPMLLLLPFLLLCSFFAATGVGLWFSAVNVKYRDVRYAVPFLIQIWLFATPVIYPASMLPAKYRWILSLNPMAGLVEAHRACILGHHAINYQSLAISLAVTVFIFVSGAFYFRRMERFFADII
jgi:lipopolysaccharide transport system permease protein